jgi:hypothetical protein
MISVDRKRQPRVALVTCAAHPALYGEERALVPMLHDRGIAAEAAVWDDKGIDWARFDAVVLRSVWDYFLRYDEFSAWLARVERVSRVWNSPSLVRWNMDKRYLRELDERGVRIVPTVFCEPGVPANLAAIVRERGWEHAVLKPAVSGTAYRTHRVDAACAETHQGELDDILRRSSALVQPFVPEIQTEGEWSLVYFDGAFSHAVLKVPARGDYRVQADFGGAFGLATPPAWMLAQASHVLDALPEAPAYARIDGVRRGEDFLLMEAELVEPYLFMAAAPGATDRYVATVERLARSSILPA